MKIKQKQIDNQTYEYMKYALAKLIYWNRRIEISPNDSFLIDQLRQHLNYSTALVGKDCYGLKENQ